MMNSSNRNSNGNSNNNDTTMTSTTPSTEGETGGATTTGGGGSFVKYDTTVKCWYKVDEMLAREKVSQTFRDALHGSYRSSNAYKKKRRREEQQQQQQQQQMAMIHQKQEQRERLSKRSRMQQQHSTTKEQSQPKVVANNNDGDGDAEPTNWANYNTVIEGLCMLDPDCSGNIVDPTDVTFFQLSSALPESCFLAQWFEEENNHRLESFSILKSLTDSTNENDGGSLPLEQKIDRDDKVYLSQAMAEAAKSNSFHLDNMVFAPTSDQQTFKRLPARNTPVAHTA